MKKITLTIVASQKFIDDEFLTGKEFEAAKKELIEDMLSQDGVHSAALTIEDATGTSEGV